MNIQELFKKPIDREIDGVIKADDSRNIRTEVEEYVFTRDVTKGLRDLTDRYLNERSANGVWISGFFGSGKSHLLKMLSLALDERPLVGGTDRAADILLPKLVDDEVVRADFLKCTSIPSRSVLFNIDQKFDSIGGDRSSAILEVFVKVLNELEGYFEKAGYLAQFERDLDRNGKLQPFKETYQRVNGKPWESHREAITTAFKKEFARAYATHFEVPEEEAFGMLNRVRDDYRVSIESFARMVKDYIDRQGPNFRLNFFVDEVGQFIGQDSKLMLNLQTVAETLDTVCDGRAWVFVTSQANLEGVLGAFKGMSAQDVTKIQGRFKTRLTLASADVREVIQKRLLDKTVTEPAELAGIWTEHKENFETLFRFGDSSRTFTGWKRSDEFCGLYPFHPYHFDLFQLAIVELSRHNAFTGKYMSVGERSMLEVFQEAAKSMAALPVGRLATFDMLYDGIAASIRGDMQSTIQYAEKHLDTLPQRILKALFLLKWVREFRATPRNISILLIDSPKVEIPALEKAVTDALLMLASESFLQRNGDVFEFLTDVEKDIEQEIGSTEIDESQVTDLLGKVLFADVLREPKIRYEGNGQDYAYVRKLDEQMLGREAELAVHIVTTEHPDHADEPRLAMQNGARAELLAVLPPRTELIDLARRFLKTEKYIRQNSGNGEASRQAILDQRSQQNSQRRSDMVVMAGEMLRSATLYLNGGRLDAIGDGDPRTRFSRAYQELISSTYGKLKMLRAMYGPDDLQAALMAPDDLFEGASNLSEAEEEVLAAVQRAQLSGGRLTIEELVRDFAKRPYGWYQMAVLTIVARLFRMGRIELRGAGGELYDAKTALDNLKNPRQHGVVRIRIQEQIDDSKISALKRLHHDFFDRANDRTDARSVGEMTASACSEEASSLRELLSQVKHYPFLEALRPVADRLGHLAAKDHTYLINQIDDYREELLEAKREHLTPIKEFMKGNQKTIYDEVMSFLQTESANLSQLSDDDVRPLVELQQAQHPYRGTLVRDAKNAVGRLRTLLADRLAEERSQALAALEEQEEKLRTSPDFLSLDEDNRARVLELSKPIRDAIATERFVMAVRDRKQRYVIDAYPKQLALASHLAKPNESDVPKQEFKPLSSLKVTYPKTSISTEAELDEWVAAFRAAVLEELGKGTHLSV